MKTVIYLYPRNFHVFENSNSGNVYYLVHEKTGEVLHCFTQKNNLIDDLKKSIKSHRRLNWIFDSKDLEIKEVIGDIEKWKEIKEKIKVWHERKLEDPILLVIVERGQIQVENGKTRYIFDLVNSKTGEIITSDSCSDRSFASIDLKNLLIDVRNDKWVELGNRCKIQYLSETTITLNEIERKMNIWKRKKAYQEALDFFKMSKK